MDKDFHVEENQTNQEDPILDTGFSDSSEAMAQKNTPAVQIAYLITATIFFALGFVLATLLQGNGEEANITGTSRDEIAKAVQGTLIALTPLPTPTPTHVPIALTFSEQDPVLGAPDAPITVVEFSDYRCPYCGQFAVHTLDPLLEYYDGLVKFVYRDFPIFGEPSLRAAYGAHCAHQQGKFRDYHDTIFASQVQEAPVELTNEVLIGFADTLHLEMPVFMDCFTDPEVEQALLQNISAAQTLLEQAGTPTFLINGRRVVGALPLEYFIVIIDEELAKLGIEVPES